MSRVKKPLNRKQKPAKIPRKSFLVRDKFIPRGRIKLPGDKSIVHRALIVSALCAGRTRIDNFPLHDDSLATLNALKSLGVNIRRKGSRVFVQGRGLKGFKSPRSALFVNNSGTTLRLLLGVLAGMDFKTRIRAAKALTGRPMSRVNVPLRLMGARILAWIKNKEEYAPLTISGGMLKGITYRPAVASAQVKSAILLAGLFAQGSTKVLESLPTRDHTERMLRFFGANVSTKNNRVTLKPNRLLASPGSIFIPGDISSAAFFCVLASIIPGSQVVIEQVGFNPGRTGFIKVLKRMGARISLKVSQAGSGCEPQGDLIVQSSRLKGTVIGAKEIPFLIDELPVLMVAACFAQGRTVIQGAGELRVKETDRINSMMVNLRSMGAQIRVAAARAGENIIIDCPDRLYAADLKSFGDHRTAMSMVVAALAADGASRIDDVSCINKSFPGFLTALKSLK